jgi:hypothetical protein
MLKFFRRIPLIMIGVFVALALVAANRLLPPDWVIMALYLILVMVAAGLSVGYFEGVWDALTAQKPGRVALYTVGAFLPWVALLALCLTAILIRAGYGDWLRSTPVISIYLTTFIAAGALQMVSPGARDGKVPRSAWIKVGVVIGFGILAAVVLIVLGLKFV